MFRTKQSQSAGLKVELACQCVRFIVKCLSRSNSVVKHVARQGVYFQRLHSPIDLNAHHCVSTVDVSLSDTADNARRLSQASYAHHDGWMTDSNCGKLEHMNVDI